MATFDKNTMGQGEGLSGISNGREGKYSTPALDQLKANHIASQNAPMSVISEGKDEALQNLQMGLSNATGTLQPSIGQGQQLSEELQNLLMGRTPANQIPGYNAMSDARRQAVGDLGTGMAGTGKFFSGTTAQGAADIGGAMQNQFMQQRIQNLMMGAQPGQQATGQLAGMQMGAGTTGAQIPMTAGTNIANLMMGQQQMQAAKAESDAANQSGFLGDILGLAGTVIGFSAGGPAGGAAGSQIGSGVAAGIGAGGS